MRKVNHITTELLKINIQALNNDEYVFKKQYSYLEIVLLIANIQRRLHIKKLKQL